MLPYAGKDVTEAMADEDEHVHSKGAYQMMDEVSSPSSLLLHSCPRHFAPIGR